MFLSLFFIHTTSLKQFHIGEFPLLVEELPNNTCCIGLRNGEKTTFSNSSNVTLNIPRTIGEMTITEIGSHAFSGTLFTKIILPETIEIFHDFCFDSNNIKEITFPASTKELGRSMFSREIESIDLSKTKLKSFSKLANNTNLKKIRFPKKLEKIGDSSFALTLVKELDFPESLRIIDSNAFMNCIYIVKLNLKNVEVIGNEVFMLCTKLTSIESQENIKVIGAKAFFFTKLKSLILYEPAEDILDSAFGCCDLLSYVDLSRTKIFELRDSTFYLSGVEEFKFPQMLISIATNALSETLVRTIVLPKTVNYIDEAAFESNDNLVLLDLSATCVIELKAETIDRCNALKTIILPKCIKYIDENFFDLAENLTEIIYCGVKDVKTKRITFGALKPNVYVSSSYENNTFMSLPVIVSDKCYANPTPALTPLQTQLHTPYATNEETVRETPEVTEQLQTEQETKAQRIGYVPHRYTLFDAVYILSLFATAFCVLFYNIRRQNQQRDQTFLNAREDNEAVIDGDNEI